MKERNHKNVLLGESIRKQVPKLGIAAAVSGIASGYHWEFVDD